MSYTPYEGIDYCHTDYGCLRVQCFAVLTYESRLRMRQQKSKISPTAPAGVASTLSSFQS